MGGGNGLWEDSNTKGARSIDISLINVRGISKKEEGHIAELIICISSHLFTGYSMKTQKMNFDPGLY